MIMPQPTIDVLLAPRELVAALQADVLAGLGAPAGARSVPPKWFYDERGSKLFDEITRLPEYYPTRRERTILEERAGTIMLGGVETLIELGSGTSDKTRLLLDAGVTGGSLHQFIPFDVSEETLLDAAEALAERYRSLTVHAVVGDFDRHLGIIAGLGQPGRRLVAFLGGTIGNFEPASRGRFLSALGATLAPGDRFLLGTDLVKDPDRLVAAYDDGAGVTAEFNLNVLSVINRELQADFDLDGFQHVAVWNPHDEWIEMRLRSRQRQTVKVAAIGLEVTFDEGEELRTEISAKFRRPKVEAELLAAGFELDSWWTDPAGDFAVSLARRS
jgi:L-histidine N-alpha-methyltransferase